jgi:hypothetical protein
MQTNRSMKSTGSLAWSAAIRDDNYTAILLEGVETNWMKCCPHRHSYWLSCISLHILLFINYPRSYFNVTNGIPAVRWRMEQPVGSYEQRRDSRKKQGGCDVAAGPPEQSAPRPLAHASLTPYNDVEQYGANWLWCSSQFCRHVDSSVDANVSEKHTLSFFRAEVTSPWPK